jgi:hypothetical protein
VAADSITNVRRNIGTSPSLVASYLIETLAVPIGDDPRVLELCKEILSKSTGTVETRAVTEALATIADSHVGFFTSGARKTAIAEPLRKLLVYPDRQVQLMAADSLDALGAAFREEAARYYLGLLETPNPISIATEPERSDIHTEAIRRLVNMDAGKFRAPIKDATIKFDLLARFKKWIAEDPERRLKFSRNDEFLKKWEAVMREDGT